MKFYLTYLFWMIFPFVALSQDVNLAKIYMDSAQSAQDQGKYDQSLRLRKKVLLSYEEHLAKNDSLIISTRFAISHTYFVQLQYDSALIWLESILQNYGQISDTFPMAMKIHTWAGIISSRAGYKLEAISFLEKAISLTKFNRHSYLELIQSYRVLGNIYLGLNKTKKAQEYIEKGINICELSPTCTERTSYLFMLNTAGLIQNKLLEHDKALAYYKLGIKLVSQSPENKRIAKVLPLLYGNLGGVYRDLGDYKRGIEWCNKAIEFSNNSKHKLKALDVAVWLQKIGEIFLKQKSADRAIPYFEQAIFSRKGTFLQNSTAQAGTYHMLGQAYHALGKYQECINNDNISLSIAEAASGLNSIVTHAPLRGLGIASMNLGLWSDAEKYLFRTLEMQINENELDLNSISSTHLALADLFWRKRLYKKSKNYYNKALDCNKVFYGNKTKYYWNIYLSLGNVHAAMGKFNEAKFYYNLAFDGTKEKNISQELQFNARYLKPIIEVQFAKAKLRLLQYDDKPGDIDLLKDALSQNQIALDKFEELLDNCYMDNCDRIVAVSLSEVIAQSLKIIFLMERKGVVVQYRERFFNYLEKSKSAFMQSNIHEAEAQEYSAIPKNLLDRTHDANVRAAYFENKLFNEQYLNAESRDSLIEQYKSKIFKYRTQSDSMIEFLKISYPKCYKIKYDRVVRSTRELQNQLSEDEAIVEYLVSDSNIYVFVLTYNDYVIEQVPLNFNLTESVSELRNSIYEYWMTSKNSDESYMKANAKYVDQAKFLYNKLIRPVASYLPMRLIIIPDGVLNYIPFDILITQNEIKTDDFRNHAYLINKHQISYNYSATLWNDLRNATFKKSAKMLLCISPEFPNDSSEHEDLITLRSGLKRLKNNIVEAKMIQGLFDADVVSGKDATVSYFLTNADQYRMLHLSTHGKANDEMGDYSFIAFSSSSRDSLASNDRLFVRDLYNVSLNAEMVVLSACETGLGELKQGEGIIGMARGFTYAGAQSLITSLWSVDDAQTAQLMKRFYEYLKDGLEKDAALRKAKLDHIKEGDQADPYFWAGFIASGNMKPILLEPQPKEYHYFLYVLLLSTILFGVWRILKKWPIL